jgi:hypothetical protein
MELSADQQTLLIAGVGWLIAVSVWALSLHARANTLLRNVGERLDPDLWQSLGAPATVKAAMQDPAKRWFRFIRSGDYQQRCDAAVIEMIDDYRRRTKFMLIVSAGSGLLLLIRFWPLLKPEFL